MITQGCSSFSPLRRPLAHVLLLVLLCLASATRHAVATATSSSCNCNHGIVVNETPQCNCLCFQDYLLPNCLYTAKDMVNTEIWLSSQSYGADVTEATPIFSSDVTSALALSFGRKADDHTIRFVRTKGVRVVRHADEKTGVTIVNTVAVVVVAMRGGMAQRLLSDAARNASSYKLRDQLTGADYVITAAFDDVTGPSLPQRYTDYRMAFYISSDRLRYMDGLCFLWALAALVIGVLVPLLEWCFLFNTEKNIYGKMTAMDESLLLEFSSENGAGKQRAARREQTCTLCGGEKLAAAIREFKRLRKAALGNPLCA